MHTSGPVAAESTALPKMKLAAHELYRGSDFDGVKRSLGYLFGTPADDQARITALGETATGRHSMVRGIRLSNVTLAHMRFGADAELSIAPQHAYHLAIPRHGEVTCFFGARRVRMAPGQMVITGPEESTLIPKWPRGVEAFCIQIRPGALESELSTLLGRPVGLPNLDKSLDLSTAGGRSWIATVQLLLRELADEGSLLRESWGYAEQLEKLVLSSLLRAIPHEFSNDLVARVPPARWSSVKRAMVAMEDEPERSWTLAELAEVAGVSGRRLQQGFGEQVGLPPMGYLQALRLERVRQELLDGVESIGECAARWGFTHQGRFSGAYRKRYGESPRETRTHRLSVMFELRQTA